MHWLDYCNSFRCFEGAVSPKYESSIHCSSSVPSNTFNIKTIIVIHSFAFSRSKRAKKAKIRNRYNQVPHLTRDTIWESDKNTRKYHTKESQEVSLFPAGDHKAARNRQDSIIKQTGNIKRIHKRNAALEKVSKKSTGGLKHV